MEKKKQSIKFSCTLCDKIFSSNGNLTRHCKEHHCPIDDESALITCPACDESFTRYHGLTRHIDAKHKDEGGTCSECSEIFSDLKSLCQHIKVKHKSGASVEDKDTKNYRCEICDKIFSQKNSLLRHKQSIHQLEIQQKCSIKCPLCDSAFSSVISMKKHLVESHDVELKEEEMYFNSDKEFKNWKREVEEEDCCFFYTKDISGNRTYYDCNRSGLSKASDSGTKLKRPHSLKTGKNCPARIVATQLNGRIRVNFQRTHVGHTQSIQCSRSSRAKRKKLTGKLKQGVTFDRILDFASLINETLEDVDVNELNKDSIIEGAQGEFVYIKDSVSSLSRFETLLDLAFGIANTTSEKALSIAIPQLESIIELLKQNQIDQKTTSPTPQLPKLPTNLPSHKNVKTLPDNFKSSKKQHTSIGKKLTDLQKTEFTVTIADPERGSEIIHVDFDHNYSIDPSKLTVSSKMHTQ